MKSIKTIFNRILFSAFGLLATFTLIFLTIFITPRTSAISEDTLDFYNLNGIYYYDPAGQSCIPSVNGININGSDATTKVWTGLVSLGFNDVQAAAIMGNIQGESGFNPFSVNGASNYNQMTWEELTNPSIIDAATGLTQNKGDRRLWMLNDLPENLRQYFLNPSRFGSSSYQTIVSEIGENNFDAVVASELQSLKNEIYNKNPSRYGKFLSIPTVEEAAITYCTWNETPASSIELAEEKCRAGPRSSYARQFYDKYAGTTSSDTPATPNNGSNVTIIGDSITVRSESAIKSYMPQADIRAEVGRHFDEGLELLKTIPQSELRNILVFALGSNANGTNEDNARAVIEYAGSNRQVVFVTDYSLGWHDYTQNNALFKSLANEYKNVIIADWATAVSAAPSKYVAQETEPVDVHPTVPDGTELFAKVLYETITNGAVNNANASGCYGGGGVWNSSDLPVYNQCDPRWGNLHFGSGGLYGSQGATICYAGCGPTSFAIMATVLLGREILPTETNDYAGLKGMYVTGAGSSWDITRVLAEKYQLQYKQINASGGSSACISAVNQALQDGWMIHTTGYSAINTPPFTDGGHYIGIAGLTSDGKWLVADSVSENRGHGNRPYEPADVISAGMNCGNVRGIKK